MYVKHLKFESYEALQEEIDRVVDAQNLLDHLEDTLSECRDSILNVYREEYKSQIHLPDDNFAISNFWLEVYGQFLDSLYWTEFIKDES